MADGSLDRFLSVITDSAHERLRVNHYAFEAAWGLGYARLHPNTVDRLFVRWLLCISNRAVLFPYINTAFNNAVELMRRQKRPLIEFCSPKKKAFVFTLFVNETSGAKIRRDWNRKPKAIHRQAAVRWSFQDRCHVDTQGTRCRL